MAVRAAQLFLAAILLVMAMSQLFRFEHMPELLHQYGLAGVSAQIVAAVIVCLEVAALPWLLRLPLRTLVRKASLVSGIGVWVVWLGLQLVALVTSKVVLTAGLLSDKVPISVSFVSVLMLGIFLALHIYTAYRQSHLA